MLIYTVRDIIYDLHLQSWRAGAWRDQIQSPLPRNCTREENKKVWERILFVTITTYIHLRQTENTTHMQTAIVSKPAMGNNFQLIRRRHNCVHIPRCS